CPICSAEFGCAEGGAGCWCETMMLSPPDLAEIRAFTEACLCPRCLSGFAERDAARTEPTAESTDVKNLETSDETSGTESVVQARRISRAWWIGSGLLLVGSMILAIGIGPVSIHPIALIQSALSHVPFLHVRSHLDPVQSAVLWQVRAPRVVMAALVGGMLAIAGSAYQGVFRNPLADPYLLGVAAGAGLGATLVIAYWTTGGDAGQLVPLAAFVGAATGVAMAYV